MPTLPLLAEATETDVGWKHFLSRKELNTQHSPSKSPETCEFPSVSKTSSDTQVCHDSASSSHDQPCTVVESTSLKEPASETFDTITNSVTTLKLTQVDASSTGGHNSGFQDGFCIIPHPAGY